MRSLLTLALFAASVVSAFGQKGFQHTFPTVQATGASAFVDARLSGRRLPQFHAVQVDVTGAPATCTINLDGSLDGTLAFDLLTGQTCTSDVLFNVVDEPARYVRSNLTAVTGSVETATDCTNATPIVVTTGTHAWATGDLVTIVSVVGNTACNVTANAITVLTSTTFELDGTTGSGAYVSGGTVTSVPTVSVRYAGQ